MTSSSPIPYPNTIKGLHQSNSSFVQVSPPVREIKRNSLLNHRNTVTAKWDRSIKSKLRRDEHSWRDEKSFDKSSHEYACIENRSSENEYFVKHENLNEKVNHSNKTTTTDNTDLNTTIKIDKSQQYSIQELQNEKDVTAFETASNHTEDDNTTSLVKSESFQHFTNKPNPTIIINNTFINRPGTDQDEFLSQFSQSFCDKNANFQSIRDIIPSIMEQFKHDDQDSFNLSQDHAKDREISKEAEHLTEAQDVLKALHFVNDMNATNDDDNSFKKSAPIASIITAILWIILILFWFLLYLKVLNVYKSSPNILPKREPTNYEICVMFLKKFRMIFCQFWKF